MQIKEFEAFTLKDCLQQVRKDLGPDAVILETRKFRKGGVMGWGARDAVCIVAAIGITVQADAQSSRRDRTPQRKPKGNEQATVAAVASPVFVEPVFVEEDRQPIKTAAPPTPAQTAAVAAARNAYSRMSSSAGASIASAMPKASAAPTGKSRHTAAVADPHQHGYDQEIDYSRSASPSSSDNEEFQGREALEARFHAHAAASNGTDHGSHRTHAVGGRASAVAERVQDGRGQDNGSGLPARFQGSKTSTGIEGMDSADASRFLYLERAMEEIRESLVALHRDQREGNERTVSAVVTAVAPAVAGNSASENYEDTVHPVLANLYRRLIDTGVVDTLAVELIEELPDLEAWSETAQGPLADAALRDIICRRIASAGAISMIPGQLKAVALIGPTGVGKTTTIAKLAAHYALVEHKRVALLTVDTYRIAAVEQLKTYSQIIDIPIGVAYSHAEVLPAVAQFADYDLLLIDTAGRSQKNIMQVGELKSLLETLRCETHLVLSASTKEQDMIEAAARFSAARVDRLIFSKLDETSAYGSLLNVADKTGIPLSYLTTGQKVPEDIEIGDGGRLADLLLN